MLEQNLNSFSKIWLYLILNIIFSELGLTDGSEIYVADQTTPTAITFKLSLTSQMEKWSNCLTTVLVGQPHLFLPTLSFIPNCNYLPLCG